MKIEQVALFGAGSVGGSLLCRQRENLDKIKVIVHGSRRERMEKEGLLTRGETFFPQIWEKGSYPDLLMVGLKNTQLKASIAELRDYVGPNTILMPLMNGISASEELREAFPENTVLTAVVYVDARKIGNELFCGETFLIQIGDAEEAVLEAIKEALLSWRISCQICADITRRQWRKWMMNVGTNQVSAILGANYGQFQQKEAVRNLAPGSNGGSGCCCRSGRCRSSCGRCGCGGRQCKQVECRRKMLYAAGCGSTPPDRSGIFLWQTCGAWQKIWCTYTY